MACTYDISAHGAKITGLHYEVKAGEILAVERGRNKVFCRVVWVGDSNSEASGLIGIECLETERLMWEPERRDLEEVYDPIPRGSNIWRGNSVLSGDERNRRRHARFPIEGVARLTNQGPNTTQIEAELRNLSEQGCLVTPKRTLLRGTELKLVLKVGNYDLGAKGQVRHVAPDLAAGIQFREIRKGDRERLQHLLRKMAEEQLEESFQLEIES